MILWYTQHYLGSIYIWNVFHCILTQLEPKIKNLLENKCDSGENRTLPNNAVVVCFSQHLLKFHIETSALFEGELFFLFNVGNARKKKLS